VSDDVYYPGSVDRRALPVTAELIERLFPKVRIRLVVEVNLDPVPGWGNVAEDYRALTQRLLDDSIGHYKPTVTIEATS
jgi:hypothetical protein